MTANPLRDERSSQVRIRSH